MFFSDEKHGQAQFLKAPLLSYLFILQLIKQNTADIKLLGLLVWLMPHEI